MLIGRRCPRKVKAIEQVWKDFFLDPSQWLDNRSTKRTGNSPDFVHSSTKEALWVDGRLNPPWIGAKLAELGEAPCVRGQRATYQSNILSVEIQSRNCGDGCGQDRQVSLEEYRKLCGEGQLEVALQAVDRLKQQGCRITSIITCLLHGCVCNQDLIAAKAVDRLIVEHGLGLHSYWGSLLIRAFGVCGCFSDALQVFRRIPRPSLLMWNALVAANVRFEQHEEAVKAYGQMCKQFVKVNEHTFVPVLKACTNMMEFWEGQIVHSHVIEAGFELDVNVGTSILQMYGKHQSLEDAMTVFEKLPKQNAPPWTALVEVFVQHGSHEEAFELFQKMLNHATQPDTASYVSILKCCSAAIDLAQGRCVHAHAIQAGFDSDMFVATSLIDHYIKCEQLPDARTVCDRLPKKDVVTWSLMIAGYAQQGYPEETLQLLEQMRKVGVDPNHVTFVSILKACSDMGAIDMGYMVHADIIENGVQIDAYVVSGVIDMYANCGSVADAYTVFEKSPNRNVVVWSALMSMYFMHNDYSSALQSFTTMQEEGFKPDEVSYANVISLCNREGLIDDGCHHFGALTESHGVRPKSEHYACMSDLLGRAGRLVEAEAILQSMPFLSSIPGWISLLGSCKTYGNKDLAMECFHTVVTLDPNFLTGYLLMSSRYCSPDMCTDSLIDEHMLQNGCVVINL